MSAMPLVTVIVPVYNVEKYLEECLDSICAQTLKNIEIKVFNLNDGKYYYVTDGLKAGDKIVTEGVQNLRDGQSITPITPAEKEAEYQKALKDQREGNIQTAFK